jgi:diketogulonate reductase-like aldo/keto reductase
MSQQTCEQFFALLKTDTTLQQEVNTALEGKEGDEAAIAFVWVGAKHCYEFTAAEATQKYQEIIAATKGELDEEALEQVAGGGCRTCGMCSMTFDPRYSGSCHYHR